MCHYTTFLCTKFQGNRIIRSHFMVTLTPFTKRKKKKKLSQFLEVHILENAWRDLFEIWNLGYWRWRASAQQKSSGFVQATQSYVCAKIALLFFLLIYSRVWRASFLGRMTHYRVSWYFFCCMVVVPEAVGLLQSKGLKLVLKSNQCGCWKNCRCSINVKKLNSYVEL